MESTGNRENMRGNSARNDRILPETRWVSAIIVPFLVVAFAILYLFPDHTKELFAWTIQPRMTPMMLGSAYLGGAYFFVRAVAFARWHWVKVGFLPVTTFATLMGFATIIHWDRFNHSHVSFFAWAILYFTTPFLVLTVWLRNRRTDTHTLDANDVLMPLIIRRSIGILGVITLLISIFLFLQPALMMSIWPWRLTPLTARVMGALFALTGAGELSIALDMRWSAVRIALQSQIIGIAAIGLAMIFSWSDFNKANPLTWIFIASILFLLVASPLLYLRIERQAVKRQM
ncbi:MAG: hypothetical protein H0W02_14015 [Ktedonobacteraceae bacterium]|nr:hypothetical protein [Ktedonobacteraceae bacterium]